MLPKEIGQQTHCHLVSSSAPFPPHHSLYKEFLFYSTSLKHSIADVDDLVDKKGGLEDMYEFAGEANIVITCMALNNETVSTSLGALSFKNSFLMTST